MIVKTVMGAQESENWEGRDSEPVPGTSIDSVKFLIYKICNFVKSNALRCSKHFKEYILGVFL